MLATDSALQLRPCDPTSVRGVAFVHINKAGGTSVSSALRSCLNASLFVDRRHCNPKGNLCADGPNGLHHYTVKRYQEMLARPPGGAGTATGAHGRAEPSSWRSRWNSTFSFAVVREPFARQVSLFWMNVHLCIARRHRLYTPSPNCLRAGLPPEDVLRRYAENASAATAGFARWIALLDRKYPTGSPREAHFSGFYDVHNLSQSVVQRDATQVSWLTDSDHAADSSELAVSLVLKLDGATPIRTLWKQLVGRCLPQCRDTPLPHDKAIPHPPVRAHYEGPAGEKAAAIVRRRMARDFEVLGYPLYPFRY